MGPLGREGGALPEPRRGGVQAGQLHRLRARVALAFSALSLPAPASALRNATRNLAAELDRQILRRLAETFEGRPVGLGTLADSVGEAADTIEDVYEPYLLQEGLLKRPPRGRVATPRAYRHLGLEPPAAAGQPGLF